ncbi:hypothetical protein KP79_PYT02748 [Mizuhopecten yessoensis]|uniref:G-protein coupled receptors family 1 profile domain-containing protein n=1 Tax=Mizuhopecten yessoensis TaxID=6573 RepID=A0A210PK56_MIZYE|nr:hypothetical protein KP79_PYT02748 [Mizuhopecten yessoensis]
MMRITKIKQWPITSKLDATKGIVTAAVPQDVAFYKLKNTADTMRGCFTQIAPTSMMIIFEIALVTALHKQRKDHKEVTNNPSANQKIRLINILTSVIVMIVLVSEIPAIIVTFLEMSGYTIDLQNSMALLNFLPLMLHTFNLVICCCISKDFRDKLFECARKFTKC